MRLRLFSRLLASADLRTSGKWFVLSGMIGVVAGLGAVAFQLASQLVLHVALQGVAGYAPREPAGEHAFLDKRAVALRPWLIPPVMLVGGLISGALIYTFAPEAEGHGTDAAIDAFHQKRGSIRARVPIVKTLASAITIGTGGSGGREGPIAQIGAGFGSFLATRLKLPVHDRRVMLAAGMGAGVGAIFRAPLAGAIFAGEILYKDADIESEVLVPAAMSSIVAYSVYSLALPDAKQFSPLFGNRLHYSLSSVVELIPLALLSIVLVGVGIAYIRVFYGTHAVFAKLPIPKMIRPAIGAALAGLLAIGVYFAMGQDQRVLAVLSTGYGSLQLALEDAGQTTVALLLAIALVKIATTSLTISSGGSGGVFGPSMVIGGCLGAAFGKCVQSLWPALVPHPEAYAIVGMAGFFAGCAHAPISTIIMVSEMTGDYRLLVPSMWVSMLCFVLCRRWTLYVHQVPSRLESPAHRGDFIVDVLEGVAVRDVPLKARRTVIESMPLRTILQLVAETRQHYYPVVDEHDRLVGIFSTDDVRSYMYDDTLWQLALARDIMTSRLLSVTPDDDLNTALRRFTELNLDELPVLAPGDQHKLLGMLRRKDAIAVYNRRVMEQRQALS